MPEEALQEIIEAGQTIDISSVANTNVYELVSDSGSSLGWVQQIDVVVGDSIKTVWRSLSQESSTEYTTTGYAFLATDFYTLLYSVAKGIGYVAAPVAAGVGGFALGQAIANEIEKSHPGWAYDLFNKLWATDSTVNNNILLYYNGVTTVPQDVMDAYIDALREENYGSFATLTVPLEDGEYGVTKYFGSQIGYAAGNAVVIGNNKFTFTTILRFVSCHDKNEPAIFGSATNVDAYWDIWDPNRGWVDGSGHGESVPFRFYTTDGESPITNPFYWFYADDISGARTTTPDLPNLEHYSTDENFVNAANEFAGQLQNGYGVPGVVWFNDVAPTTPQIWSQPTTSTFPEIKPSYPIELDPNPNTNYEEVKDPKPATDPFPTIENNPIPSPDEIPEKTDSPIPPPEQLPDIQPTSPTTPDVPSQNPNYPPAEEENPNPTPESDPGIGTNPYPDPTPGSEDIPGPQAPGDDPPTVPPVLIDGAHRWLVQTVAMNKAEIQDLSDVLWKKDFWDKLRDLIESPEDLVINVHILPFSCYEYSNEEVTLDLAWLFQDSVYNVQGRPLKAPIVTWEYGNVAIPRYYNTFLDYAPYSTARMYIPFVGNVNLNSKEVVGHTITLSYSVDLIAGIGSAIVSSDGIGIIGTYSTNFAIQVPITSRDFTNMAQGALNAVAGAALLAGMYATGGALAATLAVGALGGATAPQSPTISTVPALSSTAMVPAPSASMVTSMGPPIDFSAPSQPATRPNTLMPNKYKMQAFSSMLRNFANAEGPAVRATGTLAGEAGWCAPMDPYIYLTYPVPNWSDEHVSIFGLVSNVGGTIGEFSGLTQFDTVQLVSNDCLLAETEEIKELLMGGIVI